jgi:hypothetical protein
MKRDSFWFPFEPNRWLSNEKLALVSLEARGLWIHLLCLMYKANAEGKLLIGGNIPTTEQLNRMVGDDCGIALKELQVARVYELKEGAIYHEGVAQQLQKMNDRLDGYRRRDESKMSHRSSIDQPSIVNGLGYNNNNNNNKNIKKERAQQVRPTLAQWLDYAKEIGWMGKDVQGAFDHYEANGWRVGGKAPVKNWQAAARNCFRRNQTTQKGTTQMQPKPQIKSSCESAPLYRVMGFKSYRDWSLAGCPS